MSGSLPTPAQNTADLNELRHRLSNNPDDGEAWLQLARCFATDPSRREFQQAAERSCILLPDHVQSWVWAAVAQAARHGEAFALRWLVQQAAALPAATLAASLAEARLLSGTVPEVAIGKFRYLASAYPDDSRAPVMLAELLQDQGRPQEAAESLHLALQRAPHVAANWFVLARLYQDTNQVKKALEALDRAVDCDPELREARALRADLSRRLGRWQAAVEDYRWLLLTDPDNLVLLHAIGSCLASLEQYDEATRFLRKALAINPQQAETRLNLAVVEAMQLPAPGVPRILLELLQDPRLDAENRRAASILQQVLQQHVELHPVVQQAVRDKSPAILASRLATVPPGLLESDADLLGDLDRLARHATALEAPDWPAAGPGEDALRDLLEACFAARVEPQAVQLASLASGVEEQALQQDGLPVDAIHQLREVIQDRAQHSSHVLSSGQGQAWLRYCHASLLQGHPNKRPGQFKMVANSIGAHRLAQPEYLVTAIEHWLGSARPAVADGWPAAAFMFVTLCRIHPFLDGNGRLGRFIMAWELQSAGLQTVLIPPSWRNRVSFGIPPTWYQGDYQPLLEALVGAQAEAEKLLREARLLLR